MLKTSGKKQQLSPVFLKLAYSNLSLCIEHVIIRRGYIMNFQTYYFRVHENEITSSTTIMKC